MADHEILKNEKEILDWLSQYLNLTLVEAAVILDIASRPEETLSSAIVSFYGKIKTKIEDTEKHA